MAFIVDASVVLAWLLPDERSEQAQALMGRLADGGVQAPSLIHLEVANALLQATRRGRLPTARAAEMLEIFLALPVALQAPDPDATRDAWNLARRHGLSQYDACYLELARRRALPLATLDELLGRAAEREGVPLLR
jgi:predicted nucleic acid-binding protein